MFSRVRWRSQSTALLKRSFSQTNINRFTSNKEWNSRYYTAALISTSLTLMMAGGWASFRSLQMEQRQAPNSGRPTFTIEEVAKHKSRKDGIWVYYKNVVYDITEFVPGHPGGDKVLLAAGGSIEPFWKVYTIHDKDEVRKMLEQYRIGDLDPESLKSQQQVESVPVLNDPFVNDPERNPVLRVRSQKPFNAETPLPLLTENYVTPVEMFYKRNHLPIPDVKADEFCLEISGIGIEKPVKLSLKDLDTLPQVDVMATLQCAGNRRQEMYAAGPVQGLAWAGGAIGNAVWTGVYLSDVLKQCGVPQDISYKAEHVQFEGLDGYGASIPTYKAINRDGEVVLALKMNGKPLIRDHGFPVRVVIPGHVAARSVKWVNKIILSNEESKSHWQQNDYKGFSPSANWDKLDWQSAAAIQEMPIQSGILEPEDGYELHGDADSLHLKGYAWSGGGRSILRVDVSMDGGKTWKVADLVKKPDQKLNKNWAWTLWECDFDLPPLEKDSKQDQYEIICKAVDSSYNVQPDYVGGIYNKRGVLSNAWQRTRIIRHSD